MGYICIHGHFYQPPRENPWLEAVELQDSAYPCHDWNERITAKCYAPNGASRILNPDGRVAKIVNNYGRIGFNFGLTLLSWLQTVSPDTHRAIPEGDKESCERRVDLESLAILAQQGIRFTDGPISHGIAFENVLDNGEQPEAR
jgi:alpha-amylase/alpha-mannosidase (GH57 family)